MLPRPPHPPPWAARDGKCIRSTLICRGYIETKHSFPCSLLASYISVDFGPLMSKKYVRRRRHKLDQVEHTVENILSHPPPPPPPAFEASGGLGGGGGGSSVDSSSSSSIVCAWLVWASCACWSSPSASSKKGFAGPNETGWPLGYTSSRGGRGVCGAGAVATPGSGMAWPGSDIGVVATHLTGGSPFGGALDWSGCGAWAFSADVVARDDPPKSRGSCIGTAGLMTNRTVRRMTIGGIA